MKLDAAARRRLFASMSAASVPEASSGLWWIVRIFARLEARSHGPRTSPPGIYTFLRRVTDASLLLGGETVMSDDPVELSRHLEPIAAAHGRVLVTGLGLGCVLRGLLANPDVVHVDVVERDPDVLRLVVPHLPPGRWQIHESDALEFVRSHRAMRWDVAWHDLWSDPDLGEEPLAVIHLRLIAELGERVGWQGAWAMPRELRRAIRSVPELRAWG